MAAVRLPPFGYRATQSLFAPGARRSITAALQRWSTEHEFGDAVLDVGCGPRSWLDDLGVCAIGVDSSPAVIRSYRDRSGAAVVADATALPFRTGSFDSVWCFGLLHHLADDDVATAVREMRRVTKTGCRTVVFDGVLPTTKGVHVARLVRRLDRGRWMRSREDLGALVDRLGAAHRESVRYSALALEGVLATWNRH